ncbi:MAG: translocase [Magnetovibrio sp.]|nr:translocase [Magnetovibrio sp.]|tara:strand:+ start:776 stop:1486 length:711 start_codon:yes stop_codon:yes gene_type:complete
MSNSFQFIDIILFAMIAVFLILRLRNVLGRRDGHEGGHQESFGSHATAKEVSENSDKNIIQLTDGNDKSPPSEDQHEPEIHDQGENMLTKGMEDITNFDNTFNVEDFIVGARVAFEMVLDAYSNHDRDTLENLLSPDVLANFVLVIEERETADQVVEDTLVGIRSSEIVEAYMEGELAHVTVKFASEQVNVIRDAEGQIASGNPNEVITVIDFWTFARDTRARDPNWILVATRSLD